MKLRAVALPVAPSSPWQARHLGSSFGACLRPRIWPMRTETGSARMRVAIAWRSLVTQVVYSVCWMRTPLGVVGAGLIDPWHAVAAHDPGPTYPPLAGARAAWGTAARASAAVRRSVGNTAATRSIAAQAAREPQTQSVERREAYME